MARISLFGSGNPAEIADVLNEEIPKSGISCELVDSVVRSSDTAFMQVSVFEKYYIRVDNRASLTVVVTGDNGRVYVDAIGSGGGQGPIFKMSWGSEEDFVSSVERILAPYGFR